MLDYQRSLVRKGTMLLKKIRAARWVEATMKTILIAQHHGTFFTLNSLKNKGITDVTIIIPGSQVNKYNDMYNNNPSNPEYKAFKNYDNLISSFLKNNNLNYKAYVVEDFDVRNTLVSTLKVIADLGYQ